MIKVHHPEFDQEELLKAAGRIVSLIDNASHIKEASSSAVSKELIENNMPDKDHFMVHLIAMGDGEAYGQNRNGDYWPKAANSKYHDTFVTNGHFFREHNNRSKDVAIGHVKASAYNEGMGRIELIIHGDKKKAEEEYELAKEGKALSFSMSARVPNDRCNVCENVATKSADYCDHLKKKMNQYIPEFQKFAYAINDKPTFFDISRVKNPADRIAHYIEYAFDDGIRKAASATVPVIFSDTLAKEEGVCIPDVATSFSSEELNILHKLASAESYIEDVLKGADVPKDEKYDYVKYALNNMIRDESLTREELNSIRTVQPGVFFRKLAKAGAILPFTSFLAYVNDKSEDDIKNSDLYKAACSCGDGLGGIFKALMGSGGSMGGMSLPQEIMPMFSACSGAQSAADSSDDEVQKLMDGVAEKHNHTEKPDMHKIIRITITAKPKMHIMKLASEDTDFSDSIKKEAEKSLSLYGAYKLAAVKDMLNFGIDLDEPNYLAVAYQNLI